MPSPRLRPASRIGDGFVVAQMEKRYSARVVRAETRHDNGRTIYVLRLLNADGKVWTVQVDADSGAVL